MVLFVVKLTEKVHDSQILHPRFCPPLLELVWCRHMCVPYCGGGQRNALLHVSKITRLPRTSVLRSERIKSCCRSGCACLPVTSVNKPRAKDLKKKTKKNTVTYHFKSKRNYTIPRYPLERCRVTEVCGKVTRFGMHVHTAALTLWDRHSPGLSASLSLATTNPDIVKASVCCVQPT